MKKLTTLMAISACVVLFNNCGNDAGFVSGNSNYSKGAPLEGLEDAAVDPSLCEAEGEDQGGCYAICHIPEGNPSQQKTLYVGAGAVVAHLKQHGRADIKDYAGECEPLGENPPPPVDDEGDDGEEGGNDGEVLPDQEINYED